MADINVDVILPNPISVEVDSPTQNTNVGIYIPGPQGPIGPSGPAGEVNTGELDLRYYNINNPSGFITGIDLTSYALNTNLISTGDTLTTNLISTGSRIDALSGNLISTGNTLTTNLISTGSRVDTLSGLFTGFTGTLDATYATDSQLISTGSRIDALSGQVVFLTTTQTIAGQKTFTSNLTSFRDISTRGITGAGDFTVQKINPRIRFRDTTNNNNLSGFDIHINTGQFLIDDNDRISNIFDYSYSGNRSLLNLTANQLVIKTAADGNTLFTDAIKISGDKILNLYARPIVNNTGVLLSGEAVSYNQLISTGSRIDALSGNLISTGNTLTTNLISTGSRVDTLSGLFTGFTGNLDATYATDSQLISTGSRIDALSGNLISTGNTLTTNLISTGSRVDTLSGLFTGFTGTLDATYATDSQLISTGSRIDALSGNLISTGNTLTTNLISTGSRVDTLSGLFTGFTGTLDATYATDSQLISTGSRIDILSGNLIISGTRIETLNIDLISTGSRIDALSGNLISTGNTLTTNLISTGSRVDTLSGLFTGFTGTLDATYATDSQLISTGSRIDALSGNLISTGNTLTTNLISTGSRVDTLSGLFTGFTGTLDATYATDSQLISTGSRIDALSGNLISTGNTLTTNLISTGSRVDTLSGLFTGFTGTLDATYATDSQLISTGSRIDALSGNLISTGNTLTTNLISTGSRVDTLSGLFTGFTGTLDATYATDSQLISTGSRIDALSGNLISTGNTLTTNLISTGSRVDTLSGLFTGFTGTLDATYATDSQLISTGSRIDALSGNLISTGNTLTTNLISTGSRVDTLSGLFTGFTGTLDATYATDSQLISTGSRIDALSGNLISTGNTLTTNLISTGSRVDTLSGLFTGFTGTLDATYATDSQLISTGSRIDALSGVTVFTTGYQTINGLKDFATIPTVNSIPVLLSGNHANGLNVLVKNDDSINLLKGQPVYIYGANGDNILVRRASNTGEAFSSKTLGLLNQNLAPNAQGYVITEGALEGIDTNSANAGDPIWLGSTGDLIFGLANKPYAPNHLVYLGVVERKQANNGKIYVKVQNGFELQELHNVNIDHTYSLSNNDILRYNSASGLWFNQTLNTGIFQDQINSLSGNAVLTYGDQTILGNKTFDGNTYINNLFVTGTQTIVSTNNFSVQSPYLLLNLTGGAVDGGIFFVTGSGLTGLNDSGPIIGFDHSDKFKFGISTRNSDLSTLNTIAAVSDVTNYSGFVDNKYATIVNLHSTGSRVDTLSGLFTGFTGTLDATYATDSQLISTGSRIDALSGNLISTGNTLTTNLISTGSRIDTLSGLFTGFTGTLDATYATDSQLISTGSRIDALSGNLISTGNTLTTNLISTGSRIDTLSGLFTGFTGTLDATYATDSQLISTGSRIDALSGNLISTGNTLTTNLISTGSRVDDLSGQVVFTTGQQTINGNKIFQNNLEVQGTGIFSAIDLSNISEFYFSGTNINLDNTNIYVTGNGNIYTSGDIYISGNKVLTGIDLSSYATTSNLISTGSRVDTLSGNLISTGSRVDTLSGNLISTGSRVDTLSGNLIATGNTLTTNLISTGSRVDTLSGNLISTGSRVDTLSGNLISTGSRVDTLSGNLISTGSRVDTLSGNLISTGSRVDTLSGNLISTGSRVDTLSGNLIATGNTLTTNLISTGSRVDTLSGNLISTGSRVDTLSGNLISTGSRVDTLSGNLIATGNTLTTNLISTGSRVDTLSGNLIATGNTLTTNLISTGSRVDTLSGNLIATGNTLTTNLISTGSRVDNLSGQVVFTTGANQKVSGYKSFEQGLIVGIEQGNYVSNNTSHKMQIVADGNKTPLVMIAGNGANEIWKDTGPTQAVAFGMAVPGNSISNDLIFSRYPGGGWTESLRIQNNDGQVKIGANTSFINNSALRIGTLEFQPYGVNNAWFGDNTYYDYSNSNFYRRNNGYAGAFYFQGPEGQFRFASSDSAGTTYTPNVQLKVHLDGRFGIGSAISTSTDTFTNSNFFISSTANGGKVGIGTISPLEKLDIRGNSRVSGSLSVTGDLNITGTGNFGDMNILVDTMTVSGLDLLITGANLVLSSPTGVPASINSNGTKGSIVWDNGYLYVCVDTNSWKRTSLGTW